MKTLLPLLFVFILFNISAQVEASNSSAGLIILKNGDSVHAKKLKVSKKWVKFRPDCKGCFMARFIKLENVESVEFNEQENKEISMTDETKRIALNQTNISYDTIRFLKRRNQVGLSLVKGQKVKFSTSSNKYKGRIQSIDEDQIGFSKKRRLKNVDSLTFISSNDIIRYKINIKVNQKYEYRLGNKIIKVPSFLLVIPSILGEFTGIYTIGAGAYFLATQWGGGPVLFAIPPVGAALIYWGFKARQKKVIIGKKWLVETSE